jgi:hypothetical protein
VQDKIISLVVFSTVLLSAVRSFKKQVVTHTGRVIVIPDANLVPIHWPVLITSSLVVAKTAALSSTVFLVSPKPYPHFMSYGFKTSTLTQEALIGMFNRNFGQRMDLDGDTLEASQR